MALVRKLPQTEKEVLEFWEEINAFKQSILNNKNGQEFIFYDGPPFATGKPHYGHIVASTLKDIIPRYKTQMGFRVERRFGWDTHGLPIEFEIEKALGISTRQDVEKYGIGNYNEECRKIVMRYREDWRETITRLGRWVDFDNDYKTMDINFMESVWWVFNELYKQGKVYKSVKVMPYSVGCRTPLSNFEAKSNYKKVKDPSVVVKLQLENVGTVGIPFPVDNPIYFLIWTTTPWTLVSNLAICVNPNLIYALVKSKTADEYYILNRDSIGRHFSKDEIPTEISTFKGSLLTKYRYLPLYSYFVTEFNGAFRVLSDDYVKNDNGTGIVHLAPAFGEDDFRVCQREGIVSRDCPPPCPINDVGRFTVANTSELTIGGIFFKAADEHILKNLKKRKLIFSLAKESHEYPYCWRSETPLMYRSVDSWFVEVTSIQDELLANNEKVHWMPDFIGEKKFKSWLSNCQDWCISRNRYWGTPIPIWVSDDGEERVCVGSVAELEELAGLEKGSITDLHRHHIDHIVIPSKTGKGDLHRVTDVLDCWFESGSMPYGQFHYPFENKEKFEQNFPCDFIAEGSDQTRGWFYTLLVISTLLFKKPTYKNVIVNGMVLADDGEKMSKSKNNYPSPNLVLDKYGADALRLYLINSKVVHADSLKFKEDDLKLMIKNVHIMINNMCSYWQEAVKYFEEITGTTFFLSQVIITDIDTIKNEFVDLSNPLDSWILHCLDDFLTKLHSTMDKYDLNPIVNWIETFIDQLSRWYIKLNKTRFRLISGAPNEEIQDVNRGLSVLFYAQYYFMVAIAPFAPFLSEIIYQKLRSKVVGASPDSVHYHKIPRTLQYSHNNKMVLSMTYLTQIVNMLRGLRAVRTDNSSIKMPYQMMKITHPDTQVLEAIKTVENLMNDEINVRIIEYQQNSDEYLYYRLTVNFKVLGPKFGKVCKDIENYLNEMPQNEMTHLYNQFKQDAGFIWRCVLSDDINIPIYEITFDELLVKSVLKDGFENWQTAYQNDLVILVDPVITPLLNKYYYMKLFTRSIQEYRKAIGLSVYQHVLIVYKCSDNNKYLNNELINENKKSLEHLVGELHEKLEVKSNLKQIGEIVLKLDDDEVQLNIWK